MRKILRCEIRNKLNHLCALSDAAFQHEKANSAAF